MDILFNLFIEKNACLSLVNWASKHEKLLVHYTCPVGQSTCSCPGPLAGTYFTFFDYVGGAGANAEATMMQTVSRF